MIEAAMLCLVQAVYFESRGEPLAGQYAVAEVVMNRVDSPKFPDNVCAVTAQDLGPKDKDCQFSYMCDGVPETMHEKAARLRAETVAKEVFEGKRDLTGGALYFHASNVSPRWSRTFKKTAQFGRHSFYRP